MAANEVFGGRVGDCYICPTCTWVHPRAALDDGTLTMEHAPPESLGGKVVGLTCRTPCNNVAGTDLDFEMEKAEAHLDFVHGPESRPIKGTLEREGEQLHGNFQRRGDAFLLFGVPDANHPDAPRRQQEIGEEWIEGDPEGKTISFTSRENWDQGRAAVGWLRAAYLCAWSAVGYRYALSEALSPVRVQLAHPDEEVVPITSATTPLPSDARAETVVRVIREPEWLRSVEVVMGRHTVHLPPIRSKPDFFRQLADEVAKRRDRSGDGSFTSQGTRVTWTGWPTLYLDHADPQ